ncbi:MAG: GDP-mannose 4,6-dehydratase [Bacteroidaceae bacterium]|nr:GDP-mannose 4,6-dehydratase [Bacteroidaceae bacterium]
MTLETEILQILHDQTKASRAGIVNLLKTAPSDATVKRALASLAASELIEVVGNGPATKYKLTTKAFMTRIFEQNTNYMKKNIALITGVTGQDGSYLSEFLLEKGYEVHGIIRRSSVDFRERIAHLEGAPGFHLHYGDLSDSMSLVKVIGAVKPTEIYNLAAQSHVQVSFDSPEYTANIDATGVLRVLEAVRACGLEKTCRIYQASTSELYGKVEEVPQNENTPFHPYSPYAVAKLYGFWIVKEYREAYNMYCCSGILFNHESERSELYGKVEEVPQNENTPFHPYSPYAVAKLYGFWIVKEYREAYDMFCCSGILFNHESERRGETFVTRKITLAAARIAQGKQDKLFLGNLDSLRDWGYAKDYVECMWLILQQEKPEDFVIATGVQHSVREFTQLAFKHAGIEVEFRGSGMEEKGYDKATGKCIVEVSPDFYRPTDVVNLWGDPTKAKAKLKWDPNKTSFEELVKIMVDYDMAKVAVERESERVKTNLAAYLEKGVVK